LITIDNYLTSSGNSCLSGNNPNFVVPVETLSCS
jgi:hypothetical protein